jgi:hypothetical protein
MRPNLVTVREQGTLNLRWQVPDNLPFRMPVDVRICDRTVKLPMGNGSGSTQRQ